MKSIEQRVTGLRSNYAETAVFEDETDESLPFACRIADGLLRQLSLQLPLDNGLIIADSGDPRGNSAWLEFTLSDTDFLRVIQIIVWDTDVGIEFPNGNRRGYVDVPFDDIAKVRLALGGRPEIDIPKSVTDKIVAGIQACALASKIQGRGDD